MPLEAMPTPVRTDGGAEKVLDVYEEFPANGTYVDVAVYVVEPSNRYPEGVKYSMQYGTTAGETILRYDNFPDHPEASIHHRHTRNSAVQPLEFDGIRKLYERFKSEVRAHGEHWP